VTAPNDIAKSDDVRTKPRRERAEVVAKGSCPSLRNGQYYNVAQKLADPRVTNKRRWPAETHRTACLEVQAQGGQTYREYSRSVKRC